MIKRLLLICAFLCGTALVGTASLMGFLYITFEPYVPAFDSPDDFAPKLASEIYAQNGELIARFGHEYRVLVPYESIPTHVIQAFVAAEDQHFWDHAGIDFWGLSAALWQKISGERNQLRGASTITQQLAKQILIEHEGYEKGSERSLDRKVKEAILAKRLETTFNKRAILWMYLNLAYLGNNAYGIEAAALAYFNKHIRDVSLAEAALLAGLVKAPSRYSPIKDLSSATIRQHYVLNRMLNDGIISENDYQIAIKHPIQIASFNRNLFLNKAPYFVEQVRQYLIKKYSEDTLYEAGLKIYTTLDLNKQEMAEQALRNGIIDVDKRQNAFIQNSETPRVQGALLALNPKTGYVEAMVGGYDFSKSQFNRTIQSCRQPGSAFKPIIYSAAISLLGYTPATTLIDTPLVFRTSEGFDAWKPQNLDHQFHGEVTVREALAKSLNIPAIQIMQTLGTQKTLQWAYNLGIRSPLEANLATALGASCITMIDLVKAYGVFANFGVRQEPILITHVVDAKGDILEDNHRQNAIRVMDKRDAFVMHDLLRHVVFDGTARRAQVLERPIAGKTGTTNDSFDAWFVGYTPSIVAAVWIGYDTMEHSLNKDEQGGRTALPIWMDFISNALRNTPIEDWQPPSGICFKPLEKSKSAFRCDIPQHAKLTPAYDAAYTTPGGL